MIDVLVVILALWGGVFAESLFGAFSTLSIFIIFFMLRIEDMDIKRFLLVFGPLSLALDSVQYLPIGTHLFVAGAAVIVLNTLRRFIKAAEITDGIAYLVAFFTYYLLLMVMVYSQQSSEFPGWEGVWSSLWSAIWSLGAYALLRVVVGQMVGSSRNELRIRKI